MPGNASGVFHATTRSLRAQFLLRLAILHYTLYLLFSHFTPLKLYISHAQLFPVNLAESFCYLLSMLSVYTLMAIQKASLLEWDHSDPIGSGRCTNTTQESLDKYQSLLTGLSSTQVSV